MPDTGLRWSDVWKEERESLGLPLEEPVSLPATSNDTPGGAAQSPTAPNGPAPKKEQKPEGPKLHGAALCLSGGGIRSATFALGVLQGLARRKRLSKIDYLSTVSGGGYIGSWLTAWVHRVPRASAGSLKPIEIVERSLAQNARHENLGDPGVHAPIMWLRDHSNYLTPQMGFGSLDMWSVIAAYLRNLLINWTLLLPLLAVMLLMPTTLMRFLGRGLGLSPAWNLLPLLLLSCATGLVFFMTLNHLRETRTREPRESMTAVTLFIVGSISAVLLWGLFDGKNIGMLDLADQLKAGLLGFLLSVGVSLLWRGERVEVHQRSSQDRLGRAMGFFFLAGASVATVAGSVLLMQKCFARPTWNHEAYVVFAFPCFIAVIFCGAAVCTAFTALLAGAWEEEEREWWARACGCMVATAVGWMCVASIAIYGPRMFEMSYGPLQAAGGASGLATLLLSRAKGAPDGKERSGSDLLNWRDIALSVAAPVFVVALLCTVAWLLQTPWVRDRLAYVTIAAIVLVAGAPFVVNVNKFSANAFYRHRLVRAYLGATRRGVRRPNRFTGFDPEDNIQMYDLRSRSLTGANIVRADQLLAFIQLGPTALTQDINALLGADIKHEHLADRLEAILSGDSLAPNDEYRNVQTHPGAKPEKLPAVVWERIARDWNAAETAYSAKRRLLEWSFPDFIRPGCEKPLHVINAALNLTVHARLSWQERQARSFVFTPQYCGSADAPADEPVDEAERLGFRLSRLYGGREGVSLGTAVAVSGAAVNSSMGYHSSRAISFVMTMFNVRLGAWLGNPRDAGACRRSSPRWAFRPMLSELVAGTNASSPYVLLSDGGHFENLGLYEMIRRRCGTICVCDAGCDAKFHFDDLGNAIRKARTDFGVEIYLDATPLRPQPAATGRGPDRSQRHWVNGWIVYPDGARTRLLYLKPTLVGDGEPQDVFNYAANHADFPHQSTGDQFFSESQFESYRALGEHIGKQLPL